MRTKSAISQRRKNPNTKRTKVMNMKIWTKKEWRRRWKWRTTKRWRKMRKWIAE